MDPFVSHLRYRAIKSAWIHEKMYNKLLTKTRWLSYVLYFFNGVLILTNGINSGDNWFGSWISIVNTFVSGGSIFVYRYLRQEKMEERSSIHFQVMLNYKRFLEDMNLNKVQNPEAKNALFMHWIVVEFRRIEDFASHTQVEQDIEDAWKSIASSYGYYDKDLLQEMKSITLTNQSSLMLHNAKDANNINPNKMDTHDMDAKDANSIDASSMDEPEKITISMEPISPRIQFELTRANSE